MWNELYDMARQQSLLGVVFYGLQKHANICIERSLLLQWFSVSEQIRQTNLKVNRAAVALTAFLKEQGFESCILKGQGNTLNYPNPYIRMSGDIDVWVIPKRTEETSRSKMRQRIDAVIRLAHAYKQDARPTYHHVDFTEFGGVEVEVHYRPSFMNNLVYNHRLQQWFEEQAGEQFAHSVVLPEETGTIQVPTHAFNRIFQMAHISNHFFHEGIGLRQLLDYYYVLQQGFTEEERLQDGQLLRGFGLYKVAAAVMYVLQEAFALTPEHMIVAPDRKRGHFLLDEILQGGNFGQYDKRTADSHSPFAKNLQRLKRDVRLLRYFPSECLWEPIFRLWHFFWRMRNR